MYEFLAPWGVLAPLVAAAVTYFHFEEKRRVSLLKLIEAPDPAKEALSTTVTSYRFLDALSKRHG